MATESGDAKLLGKLIELVTVNADYNPANTALRVASLNAQKTAAMNVVADIGAQEAPYKAAINNRLEGFEGLPSIVSRARNMFKASGASQGSQNNLKSVARKITGRRKTAKAKEDPNTPQTEATKSHSVSQLSYEKHHRHFDDFIAVLKTVPSYAPNEPALTTAGLTALADDLKGKNDAVNATFVPISVARGRRDELLYLNEDCVVNTALLVKAYVRAAFGPDSQLFKNIKGLAFERQGKKPRG
jgi:hypothetical protein